MNKRMIVGVGTLVLLVAGTASATTLVTYSTPSGSTTGGGAVNAQAVFAVGNGTVGLTLTDLQANPTDVAQLISDIFFSVSNGDTALTTGSVTGTGTELTVHNDRTYSVGATTSAGWVLTNSAGVYHLDVLAGAGHAGPAHLIIGPPDTATNKYLNANGSIRTSSSHNPFLDGSATFTLTIPGVTEHSTISNVAFSFGTTPGVNVRGVNVVGVPPTTTPTPEPATVGLAGAALVLLGYLGRRRRA